MKAYKIDVVARTVTECEYDGQLTTIYKAIEADCFDCVRIEKRDYVFVSDTGLIDDTGPRLGMFELDGYPQPLAGHGYVLGCDPLGESTAPRHTLEEMRAKVAFLSYAEAAKKYC